MTRAEWKRGGGFTPAGQLTFAAFFTTILASGDHQSKFRVLRSSCPGRQDKVPLELRNPVFRSADLLCGTARSFRPASTTTKIHPTAYSGAAARFISTARSTPLMTSIVGLKSLTARVRSRASTRTGTARRCSSRAINIPVPLVPPITKTGCSIFVCIVGLSAQSFRRRSVCCVLGHSSRLSLSKCRMADQRAARMQSAECARPGPGHGFRAPMDNCAGDAVRERPTRRTPGTEQSHSRRRPTPRSQADLESPVTDRCQRRHARRK